MGRISESTIQQIKDSVDIVDVIGKSVRLKSSGRNYLGLCPFHQEKTPSFSVSPERQMYHCFGCGESGDAISFIMKSRQLSYPEALRYLADEVGIIIKEDGRDNEKYKQMKHYYQINHMVGKYFFLQLQESPEAKAYLKRRKISMKTAQTFGLGYADGSWDGLLQYGKKMKISEEDLILLGLLVQGKKGKVYDRFRNRLIFPILNKRGKIIGFGGRALGEDLAKYLNSPETPIFHKGEGLYGLNFLDNKERQIVLVEGYMDVIQAHQAGLACGVASLGTAFTMAQAQILKKLNRDIIICYDSDNAGQKATVRALEIMEEAKLIPKIMSLEKGLDPDDYMKKYGQEAFRRKMNNALLPTEYRLSQAKIGLDFDKTEDTLSYLQEAAKILSRLDRKLVRDEYIKRLAKEMQVEETSLAEEVRRMANHKEARYIPNIPKKKNKHMQGIEEELLRYSMENRDCFMALEEFYEDMLKTPEAKEMGKAFKKAYEEERLSISIEEIQAWYQTKANMHPLVDTLNRKIKREKGMPKKALEEIIYRLRREILLQKKDRYIQETQMVKKEMEDSKEGQEILKELMQKIYKIDLALITKERIMP